MIDEFAPHLIDANDYVWAEVASVDLKINTDHRSKLALTFFYLSRELLH